MALDKIGSYMNNYNAYNIHDVSVKPRIGQKSSEIGAKVPQQEEAKTPVKEQEKKGLDLTVEEVSPRENASIENIAISFGQYDISSLDLYGEKGLASEDMKSAISGMQKDKILHEYQYFVGGKDLAGKERNIIAGTEDGLVIRL